MPFGILSDFKGRKAIIILGLSLFSLGSFIAAFAHSIIPLIIGRALQGSGAVGGTLMALLSDLTDEHYRARAMAILGGVIGVSFSLSIVLGPVLNTWVSVSGIFLLCAVMGIAAILVLLFSVPALKKHPLEEFSFLSVLGRLKQQLLTQKKIARLNVSSMLLHMILMMTFISIPVSLKKYGDIAQNHQWQIYLPVLLLSFMMALGWVIFSERKKCLHISMNLSVSLIMLSQLGLMLFHYDLWQISIGLLLFFLGFNFLEATLPAEISRQVNTHDRGMAMGLYSTMQFIGIFLGGFSGGLIYGYFSITGVFIFTAIVASMWLISIL
jgi:MFS family permease